MIQDKNQLLGETIKMQPQKIMVPFYHLPEIIFLLFQLLTIVLLEIYSILGVQRLHKLDIWVQLYMAYEINRVRFWMYDHDARITDIQIFTVGQDRISETQIFDGLVQPGICYKKIFLDKEIKYKEKSFGVIVGTVKFTDQLVSKVRFYNKAGNNLSEHMLIIKIQAYYSF
ncbi:unnamed protein product [Paramecium sonneborni]|uniref:Uncharacterized protein n=1 Tax=Paramecium sonneborni TaxID=65129 RepID=A0A8S1NNH1_9CILI|nr:unnamed protein product [Paramecium sonneborni]